MALSNQDVELLSAYIDGELNENERATLENRLQDEADLREMLAELRVIVQAVRDLPPLRAPRDFTLTPEMVAQTNPARMLRFPTSTFFSMTSAAAAVLLIMLGGFLLIAMGNTSNLAMMSVAGNAAESVAINPTILATDTDQASIVETPVIVPTVGIDASSATLYADDTDAMGDDVLPPVAAPGAVPDMLPQLDGEPDQGMGFAEAAEMAVEGTLTDDISTAKASAEAEVGQQPLDAVGRMAVTEIADTTDSDGLADENLESVPAEPVETVDEEGFRADESPPENQRHAVSMPGSLFIPAIIALLGGGFLLIASIASVIMRRRERVRGRS